MFRTYHHSRAGARIFHKIHSITLDSQQIHNRISSFTINSDNLQYTLRLHTSKSKLTSLKYSLMNVRSVCNEIPEIQHQVINRNLDLYAIAETWIKQDDKVVHNTLQPKQYLMKSTPTCDQTGGGVAMVYRSGLTFDEHQKYAFQAME